MTRSLHAAIALLLAVSVFLSLGARGSCSGETTLKREGEPCTRTTECDEGLACSGGTCRPAGDAGTSDAGTDAAVSDAAH